MLALLSSLHQLVATATVSPSVGECAGGNLCDTGLPQVGAGTPELASILAIVFGIAGAIAVLVIVIGALRMVYSSGNPEGVSKARSTIIYAVVGLVIAISAEALVAFVLGKL
jgi:hypothetical protein